MTTNEDQINAAAREIEDRIIDRFCAEFDGAWNAGYLLGQRGSGVHQCPGYTDLRPGVARAMRRAWRDGHAAGVYRAEMVRRAR